MKNIIYILIDSLNYKHVKESKVELMPFYSKLKEDAIYCENMYSEAPYTEAALMSSICGQDVLNYGGYIKRFQDSPLTIFEAMQQKGYYTYSTSYEPQCYPSSVKRGLDEYEYMFGYDPAALWNYRFAHYSNLLNTNSLKDSDYEVMFDILIDNFNEWEEWLINLKNGSDKTNMIGDNSKGFNTEKVLQSVKIEKEKYLKDRKQYINDILRQGRRHKIFKIGGYPQNNKIKDRNSMKQTSKELRAIAKRIRQMNHRLNKKNCEGIFKGVKSKFKTLLLRPSKSNLKDFAKAALGTINVLYDLDIYKRTNQNFDSFKDGPSFRTHIDTFINWAKQYDKDKPYFAFLHVNDVHNPEEFFTYDCNDPKVIKDEIVKANELLDIIPETYYGNLTHDLSLRYIDGIIKYFYEQMRDNNLDKDTVIMICADHGFSFSGNPMRDTYVVNLFLENYNIPFLMTGTGLPSQKIEEYTQSKDIPSTLCDIADGIIPKEFSGKSVFHRNKNNDMIIEYCGGGCPDISRRELKIASFNEHWFVGTQGTLFKEINITEVYDLRSDPNQFINLADREELMKNETINRLLQNIEERRKSIRETGKLYIEENSKL